MAIRDILVLLDTGAASDARLDLAARLASRHEAHLIGACLVDAIVPPYVGPMVGLYSGGAIAQELCTEAYDRAAAEAGRLESRFQDTLRREGLLGDWHALSGTEGDDLVRLARAADLVLLGQLTPDEAQNRPGWALLESTLFGSGRPILVVPFIGAPQTFGDIGLIGWNGSRESTRAVHDAMPLLQCARAVTLLCIDAPDGGAGRLPGTEMAAHLARHGVPVTAAQTVSAGLAISDVLLDYAADIGADFIVAGGYGHSRLREMMLGGATRGLLRHMTAPVLLAH